MKKLLFTVTNNLAYDQRMIRICSSLAAAGFDVTLIGTKNNTASQLPDRPYRQIRLSSWIKKGPGFYLEYNIKLFIFLLFRQADLLCCIDLDTIIPVWLASKIKNNIRVYDAHEYFSQQKEIVTRPGIYKIWHWVEKTFVPKFKNGYTVGNKIAETFKKLYQVDYKVIRNVPLLKLTPLNEGEQLRNIIYQGAVNEARGLEHLIPAMKKVNANLLIYGDGNFMEQTKNLIRSNNLGDKVFLKGKLLPDQLDALTSKHYIGVNLVENIGLNQYYSLANKFFDYLHHFVPQVTMNFPEYKSINEQFEVAVLLQDLKEGTIADGINKLLQDSVFYKKLYKNCGIAREEFNWQKEEKKLLFFYNSLWQISND